MNIGSIQSTGKGYEGILNTLTVHRPITIEPNPGGGEKAPHFRLFDGHREIGIVYRESFDSESDGRTVNYLNLKIDEATRENPEPRWIVCRSSVASPGASARPLAHD
jgi:uncharacterized protein (DUF736 family)